MPHLHLAYCTQSYHAHRIGMAQNRYTSINVDGIHGLRRAEAEYESYFGGVWHKNKIWTG